MVKLTVGEILKYLVWHESKHSPFYVKCPKCGRFWVAMVGWWNNRKLFEGKLRANCPHKNQVFFYVHPGENAHFLREDSLHNALRESYGPKLNRLLDRKLTDFIELDKPNKRKVKTDLKVGNDGMVR